MSGYLQQIQRGVDFIEARLDENIELRQVSKAAGISHAHFQRIFKALTGETLKTYVRSRRMANALDLLLTTDRRILDIALAAGFESQEAFARAFKKAFRMTPTEYRALGHGNLFLKKVRFDEAYLQHVSQAVSREPTLVSRAATAVIGMRTVFYGVGSEKNNLGETLPQLWDAFMARHDEVQNRVPFPYYGIVRPDLEDPDRLEYFAAAGVEGDTAVPTDMQSLEVPGGRYAVFEHRGYAKTIDKTVDYIYATWLARSGHRHTWGPDLELYGPQWSAEGPDSVMHYAIPIAD
ncbi:MAG: AraC family transcriptional regulator [Nannocystales bacterium]